MEMNKRRGKKRKPVSNGRANAGKITIKPVPNLSLAQAKEILIDKITLLG